MRGVHFDCPAMRGDDALDDVEPEADAARRPIAVWRAALQRLEDAPHALRRNRRADIMDAQHDRVAGAGRVNPHGRARSAVLDGVGDEIGHDLRQPIRVPEPGPIAVARQGNRAVREALANLLDGLLYERVEVERAHLDANAAAEASLREVEKVVHHPRRPLRG